MTLTGIIECQRNQRRPHDSSERAPSRRTREPYGPRSQQLKRTRAHLVRQAIEYYLEDLEDLKLGLEALQDPADPILEWEDVKRELLVHL